jgi:hypothetical protein
MASSTSIVASLRLNYAAFAQDANAAIKKWKSTGSSMRTIGRDMTVAITAPLVLIAKSAIETASAFDLAVARLKGLSGPGADITPLIGQARELGATTIFTATEVAELQLELRKLGKSNEVIEGITPSVLKLAQAFSLDLAESGTFVVQTLNRMSNTFGGFTSDQEAAEYATNAMAVALKESALDIESLRSALNYVGAEANVAGLSFSETAAILGQLANAGFTGSRAGTQLRRIFIELTKEGRDVSKEFFEIVKSGVSFEEALDRVGVRAAGTFAALAGGADEMKKLEEAIRSSNGALDFMADTLDETIFSAMRKVVSATQDLFIEIGEVLKPAIIAVTAIIARMARGFSKLGPVVQVAVVAILALAAAIPPIVFGIGLYQTVVATASAVTLAWVGALKAVTLASGIIGVALAAVSLAFGGFTSAAEDANEQLLAINAQINDLAKSGQSVQAVGLAYEKLNELNKEIGRRAFNTEGLRDELSSLEAQLQKLSDTGQITTEVMTSYTGISGRAVETTTYASEAVKEQAIALRKNIAAQKDLISSTEDEADAMAEVRDSLEDYLAVRQLELNEYLNGKAAIDDIGESYQDLINRYKYLKTSIGDVQIAFRSGNTQSAEAIRLASLLSEEIAELEKTFNALGIAIPGAEDEDKVLGVASIRRLKEEYVVLQKNLASFQDEVDLDKLTAYSQRMSEIEKIFSLLNISLEAISGTQQNLDKILEDSGKSTDVYNAIVSELKKTIDDLGRTDIDKYFANLEGRLTDMTSEANLSGVELNRISELLTELREKMQALAEDEAMSKYKAELESFSQTWVGISTNFTSALIDIADGTRSFQDVVIQSLKKVLAQVLALIAAYVILNILTGGAYALGGTVGGGLKGFISSNVAGGAFNAPAAPRSMNVTGVVSGSNLIIAEGRGITAFDRTYG